MKKLFSYTLSFITISLLALFLLTKNSLAINVPSVPNSPNTPNIPNSPNSVPTVPGSGNVPTVPPVPRVDNRRDTVNPTDIIAPTDIPATVVPNGGVDNNSDNGENNDNGSSPVGSPGQVLGLSNTGNAQSLELILMTIGLIVSSFGIRGLVNRKLIN